MSVVDPSLMASEERPIELRRRDDLVIQESLFQAELSWIVKDPLALKYCRLREPEYVVFQCLDGNHSLRDIQALLLEKFPDRITRILDIQNLISSFHKQSLLVASGEGQAIPLLERARKERRQKYMRLAQSVLAMRFPGVDPERFLAWLYPKVKWFFTKWCFALCIVLGVTALLLVLTQWNEFSAKLPDFYSFFGIKNLILMAVLLVFTKSLHELGHGLSCKHFGGECHEIGFMLLVLTPAMYCDTSDSWVLRNKWHRIAIGAAGMYVEVMLAAICTFIWWFTNPGWLHFMCLNIMFLCSVSTILFNANPLLRYDGYYIMSDWLEVPNLSQKSRSALLSKLRVWCLGMEPIPRRFLPEQKQFLFAIYSVASVAYRWFILIMILWFLSEVFEPWGLQVLGHFLISLSLVGLVVIPMWKLFKFFSFPGRIRQVKRPRLMITLAIVAAILGFIFFVPFDYHVRASLVVRPNDSQKVHVQLPGMLAHCHVKPGQEVVAGQVLAELDNADERLRLAKLEGEVRRLEIEIDELERRASKSFVSASSIVAKREELTGASQQLRRQQNNLQKLTLTATRNGIVIPPPNIDAVSNDEQALASWSGTPLDPQNQSAFLPMDTWFCSIAKAKDYKGVLLIQQNDVKLAKQGDEVVFMLDEMPGKRFTATIRGVSRDKLGTPPRELTQVAGGNLPTKPEADGSQSPLFDYYEADFAIDPEQVEVMQGFRGKAKIRVGKFTIAWRINRFLKTVFNFS